MTLLVFAGSPPELLPQAPASAASQSCYGFDPRHNSSACSYFHSMKCRTGCAACCIAPSISSPIPGMPDGKPAGVRCVQLDPENRCRLFGRPERPKVCSQLQPSMEMCGADAASAMRYLARLERLTQPG